MMKRILLLLFIISSFNSKGTIHKIGVWGGYYEFVPASITIQLGDTLEWEPFAGLLPMMLHTITSDNIPVGAAAFDQVWQMPADTFFQYIPQVVGLYQYVCTPHIPMGMVGEFTVINGGNTQTYVPDAYFENYLESNGMGNGIPNDEYVTTANINNVTYLDVSNQFISDLTGIEDFTALEILDCPKNNLSSLDLSANLLLFSLSAAENQLIFLNVSNNINLKNLDCEDNQMTFLDVSNNTNLEELGCDYNQLTSLDLSNNINLDNLFCSQNNITELDLSQCLVLEKLECLSNQLVCLNLKNGSWDASVDATNNPQLNCVEVDSIGFFNSDPFNYLNFDVNVSFNTSCNNNCSTTSIQEHSTNKKLLKVTDILGREVNEKRNTPLFYIYDDGTVEKKINIE